MKEMLKVILPLMLISVLLIAGCSNDSETLQEGTQAPDFQLNNLDGQTVRLSDFRGEVILVNFWETECSYCVEELPYLQQVYDEWQEAGLVFLTISMGESPEKVAAFMQDNGYSFPVLLDTSLTAAIQYEAEEIPATFFIDEDGIIQAVKVGVFSSVEEIEDILNQLI